jgi:hypothetical protein
MDYFRLSGDLSFPDRWYLGDIDIDIEEVWKFRCGVSLDLAKYRNLKLEIDQNGIPLDFTETVADNVPIISENFAECLFDLMDEVQLIPISIPNTSRQYYIMVIKNLIDCLDEKDSDFLKFEEDNDIRPDLAGNYQVIHILKIDKSKVSKSIFRLAKYDIVIIINERIKKKLEDAQLTGLKFKLVS